MRSEKLKYPLRKIVREFMGEWNGFSSVQLDELECGHIQRRVTDIYGPTNAYRRRCRQCHMEEQEALQTARAHTAPTIEDEKEG
jgi:hypothetical protein